MSQPIANFQGNKLYLDTNTFYLFLRAITPNAQTLFREIQRGAFQAYTSALTFDELAYRMVLALIRDKYTGSPLDRLRQHTSVMIAEFYPQLQPRLLHLQSYPNLSVLEVNAADLVVMHQNIQDHHLLSRDALHLAAMQKCGCLNLVSQDGDFDHIPGLQRYTLA